MDNKALAIEAVNLVKPAIEQLFTKTCRAELHIVIMNPQLKPWEASFDDAILHECTLGTPETWPAPFDELARNKAAQTWRDSVANINHHTMHPSSLREGDVLFYGSFVYGNIVVACSGVEPWFDMLVSGWIAVALEQLTINEYQTTKAAEPTRRYRA
ncbi:hypothetical protein MUS1_04315 [Marinomonas ushuaiensis DSM 15871]|uniref:Uncharacterized protein n=1 Tax=Marinomonas ushuaiensis DSM 15871 TaxID=1122207 RepID=X7E2H1_9GAMM|nr:hypothetical protein [Marinomonas ushuaiensis]ETX10060.1 hypothetical protein MUS1_04315 [Marinomonas ushuaiensis DSM 15871]